ncbi:MAG: DNA/RNA nuclease SfsA [Enterocloster sp.]
MFYKNIVHGTFVSRPNRFIAFVELNKRQVVCHVKNTGRCRELLTAGAEVILEYHPDAAQTGRKTEYDLIAVYKGNILINMDSQAPNAAAAEWLRAMEETGISPESLGIPSQIRREVTHGDSRFDLAFMLNSTDSRPAFMEVKGVTLEENGEARFPDAPTDRGIKHLNGLIRAHQEGCEAFVLFVIQMKGILSFCPNDRTHPAFGEALRKAALAGVHVLAYDCIVTPDSLKIDTPVPVKL